MKLIRLVFCLASFGIWTDSMFTPTVQAATEQVWWVTPTLTTTTKYRPEEIAQTNSTGKKIWSSTGSCKVRQEGGTTFLFTSRTSGSCALKLILKAHGKYPTRSFARNLSVRIRVVNGHVIKPGVNLARKNLRDAFLSGANLTGADLHGANLRGADLRDANLTNANLRGADLRDSQLPDANLTGANLTDAALYGPSPTSGIMMGAMLEGANLSGANLTRTRPTDTQLFGANLQGAIMPTGTIHS